MPSQPGATKEAKLKREAVRGAASRARRQPQAPLWGGEGSLTVTQSEPPGLCGAGTPGGPCLTWPCRTRRVQAVGWKLLLRRAAYSREPDPPGPGAGPAGGPASPPPLNRVLGAPAWGTRQPWLPSSYALSGLHWPQLQALEASSALRAVLPRGLPARHVLVMATLGARLPGQPGTAGARCPRPGGQRSLVHHLLGAVCDSAPQPQGAARPRQRGRPRLAAWLCPGLQPAALGKGAPSWRPCSLRGRQASLWELPRTQSPSSIRPREATCPRALAGLQDGVLSPRAQWAPSVMHTRGARPGETLPLPGEAFPRTQDAHAPPSS